MASVQEQLRNLRESVAAPTHVAVAPAVGSSTALACCPVKRYLKWIVIVAVVVALGLAFVLNRKKKQKLLAAAAAANPRHEEQQAGSQPAQPPRATGHPDPNFTVLS